MKRVHLFLTVFLLTMLSAVNASATTVYFENTGNWGTVNAYAWNDNGNNASWPGVAVTETIQVTVQGTSNTKTLYKYTLPGAQTQIIFNGGGSQTKDLKVDDGAVYSGANTNSLDAIGKVSGDTFIPAGEVEITYAKFYVPVSEFSEGKVYIYSFSPSLFGGWPGKEMSKDPEHDDLWYIEIDEREIENTTVGGWILNNNSGSQTSDLPGVKFQDGYVYYKSGESKTLDEYLNGGDEPEKKISFKIYFYNSPSATTKLSEPSIHMLDADGNGYKEWNSADEKLTATGKSYNINGTYYDVWEYQVETTLNLTSLKFHQDGEEGLNEFTGQTFEDGKSYIYTINGKDAVQTRQLVDKPAQSKTFTIYYVNSPLISSTTKLSAPKVHLWDNSNHPYQAWGDALESMTSTGKFYLINGQYYPVWKYTVTTTLDLKNLLFFDNDDTKGGDIKNQTFEDGGSYIYNIQARGTVQDRPLVDKPTNNKTEVYIAGACEELGGWKTLPTYKFSGPYADGSYRFDRPQMETGSDHAFKIIVRKYTSDTEYTQTWLGYDAISGGNAYEEGKLGKEDNGNIYFTEDAKNVLFYYYPESGNIVITARFGNDDPVEDADEDVYIYFHTKYDLVRNGAEGAVPYAHCYNVDNHYTFSAWDTEDEKMERVVIENHGKKGNTADMTEKYTLWRFRIPKEDVNGVNTVVFYYPDHNADFHRFDSRKLNRPCSSDDTLPRVNAEENRNDQDNWTKYIYTTASTVKNKETLEYAQQTFLTYDDFVKLDRDCVVRGGRTNVYFIGGGEGMATDITGPLTTTQNEDGCFYLPTKGNRAWFKCSWIEPDHFEYGEFDNQRYWSTFDLGLVSPVMNVNDENYDPEDGNGTYNCNGNVTVKYENYNQADWKLPENDEDFYIVVDSHDDCHTVTILYINPQPKLMLDYSDIRTVELTADQAAALHVHAAHLNENATDGDAPMVTRVNIATGSVEIIGADNADTDNHSLRYVLRANGVEAGRFPDSGKYYMDMMPVADYNDPESSNDFTVRAVYTDHSTGNTFHSRIAVVSATNAKDLVAPRPVEVQGNYVCTRIGSTGHEYFCINSGHIPFELKTDTDLAYYPDYSFDDATLNYMGHDAQKLYAGNENESKVPFVDYGEHWSEYIANEGSFGLMIHRELREDRLVDETVEGEIHAMYPFLINPDADFVKVEQNGPAMAAAAADDLDYSKLSLAMMPASAPAKVSVAADSFITTAIETVGVDTDAEVMYFNLQGIRIHNPRQGEFYLRRAGNTTEKIRF